MSVEDSDRETKVMRVDAFRRTADPSKQKADDECCYAKMVSEGWRLDAAVYIQGGGAIRMYFSRKIDRGYR